jgi:hypothetical protein
MTNLIGNAINTAKGWFEKLSAFDCDQILIIARPGETGSAEYDLNVLLSNNCHSFAEDVDVDLLLASIIHRNRIKARIRAQAKRSFSLLTPESLQSFVQKLLDTAIQGRKDRLPGGNARTAGRQQPAVSLQRPMLATDILRIQRIVQPVPRPASLMQQ